MGRRRTRSSRCCGATAPVAVKPSTYHLIPSASSLLQRAVRPTPAHRYFQPRVVAACAFSLGIARLHGFFGKAKSAKNLVFERRRPAIKAVLESSAVGFETASKPPNLSRKTGQPLVLTSSNCLSTLPQRFACARLTQSCLPDLGPAFPQRSPPWLLTTAACGGLRSTIDCRPRRALLHVSYSCVPPCGPAILVTQNPSATLVV